MTPHRFAIEDWRPGARDDDRVSIVKKLDGHYEPFILNVRLKDAKLVVACLNYCMDQKDKLNSILGE